NDSSRVDVIDLDYSSILVVSLSMPAKSFLVLPLALYLRLADLCIK
ncbi:MAG: hypothetical protein ACJA2Q_002079, partial [Pseudohongiellaceae bacterium]